MNDPQVNLEEAWAVETEPMLPTAVDIVERIMTQHWDMRACPCWICQAGNRIRCRPRESHMGWSRTATALVVFQCEPCHGNGRTYGPGEAGPCPHCRGKGYTYE